MNDFRPDWQHPDDLPPNHNDLPVGDREHLINERVRLLHIHAQSSWHAPATIVGNRNALIVLRDIIDAALAAGKAESQCMVRDGEGFDIGVEIIDKPWDDPAWEAENLPYMDPIARGCPDPLWDLTRLRQALRQANEQLVKRGVRPVSDPTAREDQPS